MQFCKEISIWYNCLIREDVVESVLNSSVNPVPLGKHGSSVNPVPLGKHGSMFPPGWSENPSFARSTGTDSLGSTKYL